MRKLVTIGIPIYKRLEHLPHVLDIVAAQDYPEIELVVSDNGMNGDRVREIVRDHYKRPCVFRQNPVSVSIGRHFNQVVEAARGEYFVMLCDDDEISANFVSELVDSLERHPEAVVAISRQELMEVDGTVVRRSKDGMPPLLGAPEFIESIWQKYEFGIEILVTVMARTARLRACGAYPDFCRGTGNDNAALVRMIVGSSVVLNPRCVFRWRLDEASYGWSVSSAELARAAKEFIGFLSTDPVIGRYRAEEPAQWRKCERILARMTWETYLQRWTDIYRKRLGPLAWLVAAFGMPFIPAYYKRVARIFLGNLKHVITQRGSLGEWRI
jgi:glycosyltransferase involved in cell wall biosynthesis